MNWFVILAVTVVGAGCDRHDVKVYEVSQETSGSSASPKELTWTLPSGWQEMPPSQMRVASFAVPGEGGAKADVSVVAMAGGAGGELANVIRWRGQVGLPPVSPEELPKLAEKVETAGEETSLYDMAGSSEAGKKERILATTVLRDGMSWFFKMSGDDAWVAQQKPAFLAFLKSVRFTGGAPASGAMPLGDLSIGENPSVLPTGHPPIGEAAPAGSGDGRAESGWTLPPGWTEEVPTAMLLAKFAAGPPEARAEITVSTLGSEFGGLPNNINRWRKQMGLPQVDDDAAMKAAAPFEVQAEKGWLIELDGTADQTGRPERLNVAVVPHDGQTWFFKMRGDPSSMVREKEAFLKFIQTAKLTHAP